MASDPAMPQLPPATTKQLSRKLQFYLVLTVAFALPILTSSLVFFGHRNLPVATQGRVLRAVVYEVVGLLCLYAALRYQKRNFTDIGARLPMRIAEVGHSFALFLGAFPLAVIVFLAVFAVYAALGHQVHRTFTDSALFGSRVTLLTVFWVFLNPFYEELIVRGFLITEVEHFYGSTALAIFVSVVLQSFYHLYQGLPAALVHASTFLLFSIYFVRNRRILPVVVAHLFLDVGALALFAHHLPKS